MSVPTMSSPATSVDAELDGLYAEVSLNCYRDVRRSLKIEGELARRTREQLSEVDQVEYDALRSRLYELDMQRRAANDDAHLAVSKREKRQARRRQNNVYAQACAAGDAMGALVYDAQTLVIRDFDAVVECLHAATAFRSRTYAVGSDQALLRHAFDALMDNSVNMHREIILRLFSRSG